MPTQPARRVQFLGYQCLPVWHQYAENGRKALQLVIEATGEPMCTASVNGYDLAQDEIAIKDYSENEGVLQALQDAGIIGPVLRDESAGFVAVQICKILEC